MKNLKDFLLVCGYLLKIGLIVWEKSPYSTRLIELIFILHKLYVRGHV